MQFVTALLLVLAGGAQEAGEPGSAPQPEKKSEAKPAQEGMTTQQETELVAAFDALATSSSTDAGPWLRERLADASLSFEQWQTFFGSYFLTRPATAGHYQFWDSVLRATRGPEQVRAAAVSACWASAAVRGGLDRRRQTGQTPADLMSSASWLARVAEGLNPETRAMILESIDKALEGHAQTLAALRSARDAALYVELLVAAARYAPDDPAQRPSVSAMLSLEPAPRQFWENSGLLLFGEQALDPQQLASLTQLAVNIPRELHGLDAVIVPEGMGPRGFASRGETRYITVSPVPMWQLSDSGEFISPQKPSAPEFTLQAAQQFVRAIQQRQFTARPELGARRDLIASISGGKQGSYLRHTVSPSLMARNPGELLPAVAYLWFINSERAFQQAAELFQLRQPAPMNTVALFADMMSGGDPDTPVFAIDVQGNVAQQRTRLVRAAATGPDGRPIPGSSVVSGIEMLGRLWLFQYNNAGVINRVVEQ